MNNVKTPVVLVMAGGTGGHIFPALAVADILKQQGAVIEWLGTRKGMEARLVPEHNYPVNYIDIGGLRGKGLKTLFLMPFKLLKALFQTLGVYHRIKPDVVLGMGGFVTGPGGLVAWILGKPLVVHEQNAIAGLTNKLLSKLAKKVFAAFPGAFKPDRKVSVCGNPVRKEIVAIEAPEQRLKKNWAQGSDILNILVVGGSLGAMALNETIPEALKIIKQELIQEQLVQEKEIPEKSNFKGINIKHQCGEKNMETTLAAYQVLDKVSDKKDQKQDVINYEVMPFINNMAESYAGADIIICRSGALTISEIAAAGLASILVPFPYAVDDHQTANAVFLADKKAAILIQQNKLDKNILAELLMNLTKEKIMTMSVKSRELSISNAAELVAQECLSLAG